MTYEILVDGGFTARHGIRLPDGDVEPGHAHTWQVRVRFVGSELDECGRLVDFEVVKADLDEVCARLDQSDLNTNPAMRNLNPTAEYVARIIFEAMLQRWDRDQRLCSAQVTEAPGCTAVYGCGEHAHYSER